MLVEADTHARHYRIAINNATGAAELISDLSFLDDAPRGELVFDFTHMTASLTQEKREGYLPGGFGYQPMQQLVEVVAVIARYLDEAGLPPHQLVGLMPGTCSRVGRFLADMRLPALLGWLDLDVRTANPASE